jgi:hypothetical protein
LLENEEKYIIEYYDFTPVKKDSKSFVFEKGGKLKYHLNENCEFLKRDYVNFHIPKSIIDLGDEVVEEFRAWFKSKGYIESYFKENLDVSKVVFDFNMKFPSKYSIAPLNENYKLVLELDNSNSYELNIAFNYNEFKDNISIIKKKRMNRFQCKTSRFLSKYDYLLNKSDSKIRAKISEVFSDQFVENYGLNNLKELFMYSISLKKELFENLTSYFRWSYKNQNLAIDSHSLDRFGLECCNKCSENSGI